MVAKNKSTAKQAAFCESLAAKLGEQTFNQAFEKAARFNGNYGRSSSETVTQAVRRLTNQAASKLISHLLEINNGEFVPEVDLTPKPNTYLYVNEPTVLSIVEPKVPNDLLN